MIEREYLYHRRLEDMPPDELLLARGYWQLCRSALQRGYEEKKINHEELRVTWHAERRGSDRKIQLRELEKQLLSTSIEPYLLTITRDVDGKHCQARLWVCDENNYFLLSLYSLRPTKYPAIALVTVLTEDPKHAPVVATNLPELLEWGLSNTVINLLPRLKKEGAQYKEMLGPRQFRLPIGEILRVDNPSSPQLLALARWAIEESETWKRSEPAIDDAEYQRRLEPFRGEQLRVKRMILNCQRGGTPQKAALAPLLMLTDDACRHLELDLANQKVRSMTDDHSNGYRQRLEKHQRWLAEHPDEAEQSPPQELTGIMEGWTLQQYLDYFDIPNRFLK